jgi:hypothetical protein
MVGDVRSPFGGHFATCGDTVRKVRQILDDVMRVSQCTPGGCSARTGKYDSAVFMPPSPQ